MKLFVCNALDPDSYIRSDFAVFGVEPPLSVNFEKKEDAEKVKNAMLWVAAEARREALEEAAMIADKENRASKDHIRSRTGSCLDNSLSWYHLGAMIIASEIRSLLERKEVETK